MTNDVTRGGRPVRLLPEAVANQIAAGEVVERPASVVKELLENALDAGARRIKVEVLGGGQALLRVTDDGHGMAREDAVLAVTRHATSKIARAEDLVEIATFGFRGEALPSIASVSRFELCTAEEGALEGTRVRVEGGGTPAVDSAPAVRGTAIEISDLFFNVPARRKFLKRAATELSHVSDIVARLALAHPEVGFKLLAEGRSVLDAPPLSRPEDAPARLGRLLGKTTAEALAMLEDDGLERPVRVRGWLGIPPLSERGQRGQHVFVNGRYVKDKTIAQAVADAYQGRLPKGRQPVVVLHLELAPHEVDVNVHPQKTEVRFARSGEVFRAVQSSLRRALASLAPVPRVDLDAHRRALSIRPDTPDLGPGAPGPAREPTIGSAAEPTSGLKTSSASTPSPTRDSEAPIASAPSPTRDSEAPFASNPSPARGPEAPSSFGERSPFAREGRDRYRGHGSRLLGAFGAGGKQLGRFSAPSEPLGTETVGASARPSSPIENPPSGRATNLGVRPAPTLPPGLGTPSGVDTGLGRGARTEPTLRPGLGLSLPPSGLSDARRVGVIFGSYLLLETDARFWILDLAAAESRLEAEAVAEALDLEPVQALLVPLALEFDPTRVEVARGRGEDLRSLGFELVESGEGAWLLRSAPQAAAGADLPGLVRGLLDAWMDGDSAERALRTALAELRPAAAATRRGAWTLERADATARALDARSVRDRAPDGRPLVVAFDPAQVAGWFGRTR